MRENRREGGSHANMAAALAAAERAIELDRVVPAPMLKSANVRCTLCTGSEVR